MLKGKLWSFIFNYYFTADRSSFSLTFHFSTETIFNFLKYNLHSRIRISSTVFSKVAATLTIQNFEVNITDLEFLVRFNISAIGEFSYDWQRIYLNVYLVFRFRLRSETKFFVTIEKLYWIEKHRKPDYKSCENHIIFIQLELLGHSIASRI